MLRWLVALSFAALWVDVASARDIDFTEHSVRKAYVLKYDPLHHELILEVDYEKVVLHTERAVVFGKLEQGRIADVAYESDTWRATQIVVRPDKLRSYSKP